MAPGQLAAYACSADTLAYKSRSPGVAGQGVAGGRKGLLGGAKGREAAAAAAPSGAAKGDSGAGGAGYAAALLKRQAAAVQLKAAVPSIGASKTGAGGSSISSSTAVPRSHLQATTTAAAAAAAARADHVPSLAAAEQRCNLNQQPQPQLPDRLHGGHRHSSMGSNNSNSSAGSYAAQLSHRSAALSAGGAYNSSKQQQQQQQQLSSALSAISAVTAANTAAAAMLRAASEARHAAAAAAAAAAAPTDAAAGSGCEAAQPTAAGCSQQGGLCDVPPPQQQLQQLQQPVSLTGHDQSWPADGAAGAAPAAVPETTQHTRLPPAAAGWGTAGSCGGGADCGQHSPTAAGIAHSKLRRLQTSYAGSPPSSAAGGTSQGRALLLSQQAASPLARRPGLQSLSAAMDQQQETSSSQAGCSPPLPINKNIQHLQQHQQQGQDLWVAEDLVTSWYHHGGDDSDSDSDSTPVPPAAASLAADTPVPAAAPAAVKQQLSSPGVPRLPLPSSGGSISGSVKALLSSPSLLTPPAAAGTAGSRLLTTSSGGIEYAQLFRAQPSSPGVSPRLSRFQSPQQQQQRWQALMTAGTSPSKAPAGMVQSVQPDMQASSHQLNNQLVTGWYGCGLRSIGSDNSSTCSPSACYNTPGSIQEHQQAGGGYTEVPHAPAQLLFGSSGGGAQPQVQRHSSLGGWSCHEPSPSLGGVAPCLLNFTTPRATEGAAGSMGGAAGSLGGAPGRPAGAVAAVAALGLTSTGSTGDGHGHVGTFDLRPCLGGVTPPLLLSARDASVSELLDASQAQIHCMESTLASMLQVAKRWTGGGFGEEGEEEPSLRGRFS